MLQVKPCCFCVSCTLSLQASCPCHRSSNLSKERQYNSPAYPITAILSAIEHLPCQENATAGCYHGGCRVGAGARCGLWLKMSMDFCLKYSYGSEMGIQNKAKKQKQKMQNIAKSIGKRNDEKTKLWCQCDCLSQTHRVQGCWLV